MKEITEADLIIGAKYYIPEWGCPPYIFFGSTKTLGIEQDNHLVFINGQKKTVQLLSTDISSITQIHDPVEKSMDLWVVYSNNPPSTDHWLDKLTNFCTTSELFYSEEEAFNCCDLEEKIKKINVTVKY